MCVYKFFGFRLLRGFSEGCGYHPDDIGRETEILRTINDKMKVEEELLDRYCRSMTLSLKHTQQDPDNMYYAYVTRDDLTDCFGDSVVLTLRNFDYYETSASGAGSEMEVRNGGNQETMLINKLKVVSYNTSIDVRLVTDEGHVFSKEALAAEQLVNHFFMFFLKYIFFFKCNLIPEF